MRLLTAWSHDYWPLAKITIPNKIEYAGRWGLQLVTEHHPKSTSGPVAWETICWPRVDHWKRYLPGSGWLFTMGCDAVITNLEIDPFSFIDDNYDIILACDGHGINAEVMLLRECENVLSLIDRLYSWQGYNVHEQTALAFELGGVSRPETPPQIMPSCHHPLWDKHFQFVHHIDCGLWPTEAQKLLYPAEFNRSDVRVKILPQRQLNAYPAVHYGHGLTGKEEGSWQPGDFCLHLVAKDLRYRVDYLGLLLRES